MNKDSVLLFYYHVILYFLEYMFNLLFIRAIHAIKIDHLL